MPKEAEAGKEGEERLAWRFKAERKRLGLTRRRIADQCGVTEATVFNWEHSGVRIPLMALDRLLPLGFDPDDVLSPVAGTERVAVMDAHGTTGDTVPIPSHVARKVDLSPSDLFVHWNASDEPAGDLPPLAPGLFRLLFDDVETIKEVEGLFLLKARRKGRPFACQIRPADARRVEASIGQEKVVVAPNQLWRACVPLGMLLRVMGLPWPGKVQTVSHAKLFRQALGPK